MGEFQSKLKFLSFTAMLLFFIIAPVGSWFYLKQGENFRKQQIEELTPKGDLNLEKLAELIGNQTDSIKNELIQICLLGKNQPHDSLLIQIDELEKQFGDRPEYNILQLSDSEENKALFNPGDRKNIWSAGFDYKNLQSVGIQLPANTNFPAWVLVDIHGRIRHFYAKEEKEKLVVHTAMILPLEKRKKINVKRDEEK